MTENTETTLTADELAFVAALRDGNLPDAMRVFKRKHAIIEPEEARRAAPVQQGDYGQLWAHGWQAAPQLTVHTNNADDLHNIPSSLSEYGNAVVKMENFGVAFGIAGKLVEDGFFTVNFDNPEWHEQFKMLTESILEVLNRH